MVYIDDVKANDNWIKEASKRAGNHFMNLGLIFYGFGINPKSFKKPRHAKKYFKKHLQPLLQAEDTL